MGRCACSRRNSSTRWSMSPVTSRTDSSRSEESPDELVLPALVRRVDDRWVRFGRLAQDGLAMAEGVEPGLAVVRAHPARPDAPEWQFADADGDHRVVHAHAAR